MIFYVDVDGPTCDLHTAWLALYNSDYNDDLTEDEITSWDMAKFVKPECGDKIFDYLWGAGVYEIANPVDGALSAVQWLRSLGHRVVFLTSGLNVNKIEWLRIHGFITSKYWRSDPDFIIAHDKSLFHGDVMIDDRKENMDNFNGLKIVFEKPWSTSFHDSTWLRYPSWAYIVSYLSENVL